MFTVAEAKSEYYQRREDAAMEGIDQPVTFVSEVREARGFIQGSRCIVNLFWICFGSGWKSAYDQR